MALVKTWFFTTVLLLNSLVMVILQVISEGGDAEESLDDTVKNHKHHENDKSYKFTKFPSFLQAAYQGRSGDYYDEMPVRYKKLFETTIFLETVLFCFVLFYGVLHLPCWETLYNRWKKWATQTQKDENEEEQEGEEEVEAEEEEEVEKEAYDTQSD